MQERRRTSGLLANQGFTAGLLLDGALPASWTRYVDLTAAAGHSFLKHDKFELKYSGSAVFVPSTLPGAPVEGEFVYTVAGHQFQFWNGSAWVGLSSGSTGVASVTGTANQVTVSPVTGNVIVSLPASGTLPGSWTAQTAFIVGTDPGGTEVLRVGGATHLNLSGTVTYPTPGTGKTGVALYLERPAANDDSSGLGWGAANATVNTVQAGIFVQSSGAYGTKMRFATTDSYATGAQSRWQISHQGHLLVEADNAYDLGVADTTRVKGGFFVGPVSVGISTGDRVSISAGGGFATITFRAGGVDKGTLQYDAFNMNLSTPVSGPSVFISPNGVTRWQFRTDGHLAPANGDNTADIGLAATRVRSIYVGTSVVISTDPAGTAGTDSAALLRLGSQNVVWANAGRLDLAMVDKNAAADAKRWDLSLDGQGGANTLNLLLRSDTAVAGNRVFTALRSANTLTSLSLVPDAGLLNVGTGTLGSGQLNVGASPGASITLSGLAANVRDFIWMTAGVSRWVFRTNSDAEGGANAGSNFQIIARDDAGAIIDSALFITRAATGKIELGNSGSRSVVVGADPTGSELLRVGGDVRATRFGANSAVLSNVGYYAAGTIPSAGGESFGFVVGAGFTGDAGATTAIYGIRTRANSPAIAATFANLKALQVVAPTIGAGSTVTTAYGIEIQSITGAGTNYAVFTNAGDVSLGDRLVLRPTNSKIVPGATDLSLRNNADSANNVNISDAGIVQLRNNLRITRVAAEPTVHFERDLVNNPRWEIGRMNSTAFRFIFADDVTAETVRLQLTSAAGLQLNDVAGAVRWTVGDSGGATGMEIGRQDGTAASAFIDFHSGATAVDYDARIIGTAGNGVIAGGTLNLIAATVNYQSTSATTRFTLTDTQVTSTVPIALTGLLTIGAGTTAKILIDGTDGTLASGEIGVTENNGELWIGARSLVRLLMDDDNTGAGSVWIGKGTQAASTTLAQFDINGSLLFSTAATKIIPGATSLALRNNADSASNLLLTDAGIATLRNDLVVDVLGTFDHTGTRFTTGTGPVADDIMSWHGSAGKWRPRFLQTAFTSGAAVSQNNTDTTFATFYNSGPALSGVPVAPVAAPVVTALYKATLIDMSAYVLGATQVYVLDYSINGGAYTSGRIVSTSAKVIHSSLDPTKTYAYKYLIRGASDSAYGPASGAINPATTTEANAFGLIVASQIATAYLSAINANIGSITAGQLISGDGKSILQLDSTFSVPSAVTQGIFFASANPVPGTVTGMYIDFSATTTNSVLHHAKLDLRADGSAQFGGQVDIAAPLLLEPPGYFTYMRFRDPDVAHGMTSRAATDVLGTFGQISPLDGGFTITGFCETQQGIQIAGYEGIADSSAAAVSIQGFKKSGTTAVALGTNEMEVAIGTQGIAVFGDGAIRLQSASTKIYNAGTSITFRNTANSASNIIIADAGAITIRNTLTLSDGTSTAAWSGGGAPAFGTTSAHHLNLMAGGVNYWKILNGTGDLTAVTDNSYDIGGASNRPKSLWLGTAAGVGTAPLPTVGSVLFSNDSGTHMVGIESGATCYIGTISTHAFVLRTNSLDRLTISSSGQVTVASSNLNVNGLTYVWPSAQAVGVLANDGAGNLTWAAGAPSIWTKFTQDLGHDYRSGTFDITGLSGLTVGKVVQVVQTGDAIASKGNATDEFEMDAIVLTGYVLSATTIRVYWWCADTVDGTYAFAYTVGA